MAEMTIDAFAPELQAAFRDNAFSGTVGSILVSESDRVRVWHLTIPAGCSCAPHRHVLDYFWTVHSGGRARNYFSDGRITATEYQVGDTQHMSFGPGEYMLHAVENIGDTDLLFTTVEFLNSANAPLAIPDDVRLERPKHAA